MSTIKYGSAFCRGKRYSLYRYRSGDGWQVEIDLDHLPIHAKRCCRSWSLVLYRRMQADLDGYLETIGWWERQLEERL